MLIFCNLLFPGAPIVTSSPHFRHSDPVFLTHLEGLNPTEEHDTLAILEPVCYKSHLIKFSCPILLMFKTDQRPKNSTIIFHFQNTGLLLKVSKKVQISLEVQDFGNGFFPHFAGIDYKLLPVFWANEVNS